MSKRWKNRLARKSIKSAGSSTSGATSSFSCRSETSSNATSGQSSGATDKDGSYGSNDSPRVDLPQNDLGSSSNGSSLAREMNKAKLATSAPETLRPQSGSQRKDKRLTSKASADGSNEFDEQQLRPKGRQALTSRNRASSSGKTDLMDSNGVAESSLSATPARSRVSAFSQPTTSKIAKQASLITATSHYPKPAGPGSRTRKAGSTRPTDGVKLAAKSMDADVAGSREAVLASLPAPLEAGRPSRVLISNTNAGANVIGGKARAPSEQLANSAASATATKAPMVAGKSLSEESRGSKAAVGEGRGDSTSARTTRGHDQTAVAVAMATVDSSTKPLSSPQPSLAKLSSTGLAVAHSTRAQAGPKEATHAIRTGSRAKTRAASVVAKADDAAITRPPGPVAARVLRNSTPKSCLDGQPTHALTQAYKLTRVNQNSSSKLQPGAPAPTQQPQPAASNFSASACVKPTSSCRADNAVPKNTTSAATTTTRRPRDALRSPTGSKLNLKGTRTSTSQLSVTNCNYDTPSPKLTTKTKPTPTSCSSIATTATVISSATQSAVSKAKPILQKTIKKGFTLTQALSSSSPASNHNKTLPKNNINYHKTDIGISNKPTNLITRTNTNLKMVDQAVIDKLEAGFAKLQASTPDQCHSLLKKYLTREVLDKLKNLKTAMGATLLDVVQSGFENLDSGVGVYAPDAESYTLFADLFNPIIEDYHGGFKPSDKHPASDFGDLETLVNVDPNNEYVISTRVRCGRSLKGYPFNPCLTEAQYKEMQDKVSSTLKEVGGDLAGTYYPLTGMTKETQQQLIDDHFLFKEGDRFLQAANACRYWPTGRGIYHNASKTFLVWVNEEDHLRIISMQKGGDLKTVFGRLVEGARAIEAKVPFSRDDRLGFLTFCPTNLGTTIRASVHIKLPKLAADRKKLEEVASRYNLQVRGTSGEHTESIGGVYDISNKRRLGLTEYQAVKEMQDGILELIKIEKSL